MRWVVRLHFFHRHEQELLEKQSSSFSSMVFSMVTISPRFTSLFAHFHSRSSRIIRAIDLHVDNVATNLFLNLVAFATIMSASPRALVGAGSPAGGSSAGFFLPRRPALGSGTGDGGTVPSPGVGTTAATGGVDAPAAPEPLPAPASPGTCKGGNCPEGTVTTMRGAENTELMKK